MAHGARRGLSQYPIGGLELSIGAGGAMVWKKLRGRKNNP